ncbi:hypothetical protein PHISCL_11047 [Aspergillus sclerotialis]|uniref:Uncharacterized protein n=1 Tax=Aspergillus sclerotialis TaxID=2070753 RepID=A0A3A2Z152_9EURO|nr:hypothetical protein PHISCL_11047 [Aspergillus sclerotialis]
MLARQIAKQAVRHATHDGQPEHGSHSDAEICQSNASLREPVLRLEDGGHGGEQEVQVAVDHRDVQREEEDDR